MTLFVDFFGAFLCALLIFNKGFAYLFVWLGPLPLFVTEAMLLILVIAWLTSSARNKRLFIIKDPKILLPLAIIALETVWGLRGAFFENGQIIDSIKRSALGYYAAFCFLSMQLFFERRSAHRILVWMFAGSLGGTLMSFLLDFTPVFKNGLPFPLVGVALITAVAFCAIYSFCIGAYANAPSWLSLSGAFAVTLLVFSASRSTVVATLSIVAIALLLTTRSWKNGVFRRHAATMGAGAVALCIVFYFIYGVPGSIGRFRFLTGIGDFLNAERNPPPPAAKPVAVSSVVPTATESMAMTKAPKPQGSPTSAAPLPRPSPPPGLIKILDKVMFSKEGGGNASWRLKVWAEGIETVVKSHPLTGMGFSEPLIIRSISPFKNEARFKLAVAGLRRNYDFQRRLTDGKRKPYADVVPSSPLKMTDQEWADFVSFHWYGIDFHNSHLAIFYRMGLFGLLAYLFLVATVIARLFPLARGGDPIATIGILFVAWYIAVAAFNVVLEGPFLGAVFWVFLGLMTSYAFAKESV